MNDEPKISNAIIVDVKLCLEGHGLLTAFIMLDYDDGLVQGFGGYNCYLPNQNNNLYSYAGRFIYRSMEVAGVSDWSQMVGKSVRAKSTQSKVTAIGHITRNDWFDPSADFATYKENRS